MSNSNIYILLNTDNRPLIETFIGFFDSAAEFLVFDTISKPKFRQLEQMGSPLSFINCHPAMAKRPADLYNDPDMVRILMTPEIHEYGIEQPEHSYNFTHSLLPLFESIAKHVMADMIDDNQDRLLMVVARFIDTCIRDGKSRGEIMDILFAKKA